MLADITTRQTPNSTTNLYALVLKVNKNVNFNLNCKIVQTDYNNYNFKNISIVSANNTIKIYDENTRNQGIKIALISDTENYYLYVNGSLTGNRIDIYINECDNLNYINLVNNSRFSKDINNLLENEKLINTSEILLNTVRPVSISLDSKWTTTRAYYTVKNGTCFSYLLANGNVTYSSGLLIVSGLPKPNTYQGEPLIDFPCFYKTDSSSDYKVCRCGLDYNGNLKIWDAPSSTVFSSIMVSISYPTRN